MIVTSLSLDDRFHVAIPLYDPEFPGFRMADLRVTGTEMVAVGNAARRAWIPSVSESPHPPLYYRVDVATHRMLQKDFGDPAAASFRVRAMDGIKR